MYLSFNLLSEPIGISTAFYIYFTWAYVFMDLSGYISLQPEFISMLHLGCSLERTQINYEVDVVV